MMIRTNNIIYPITVTEEQPGQLPQSEPLRRPVISAIVRMEEYDPQQVLVLTSSGLLRYQTEQDAWTSEGCPLEEIDMEFMEPEIWKAAKCKNKEAFAGFRGALYFFPELDEIEKRSFPDWEAKNQAWAAQEIACIISHKDPIYPV